MSLEPAFEQWMAALEERHLADLTFKQVSGALRALSSAYVERRGRLAEGAALEGAGKRAAFALFYGPLHYLLVRSIVRSLPQAAADTTPTLLDLGCGTGASGAAWAVARRTAPRVIGIDRHQWAVAEAALTYRHFGLTARTRQDDIAGAAWPTGPISMLAAFTLNELSEVAREAVLTRAVERVRQARAAKSGERLCVLVVEPLAGFVAPWWGRWRAVIEAAGGRADEWRVRVELPAIVAKLDRASGLNHRELTGRSLWLS
ncbi:MAG: class I SAM-dependent methyltransferase [Vicinamibacterales bacterium]